ncbi:MAG: hypothetical protein PHT54_04995 [Candidatus Nanoarchaeia archaeon]|nr:hypothetical protein [Candidatus Nanoarchaeia archaeon]
MKIKELLSKKRILFILLFIFLVFIGNKINFSEVIGSKNQYFTLFQFFGPIASSFLGSVFGIIVVLSAELLDFLIVGKAFTIINLLRLTPMLFAAYYFGTRKKTISIFIPTLAILLFILHPIGKQAWVYSLFWLVPIAIKLIPNKSLFLKSLGATLTAHCIGTIAWIYTVPMTADQWIALIPTTAYERFLFALGISASYLVINTVLDFVVEKLKIKLPVNTLLINKKYSLLGKISKINI